MDFTGPSPPDVNRSSLVYGYEFAGRRSLPITHYESKLLGSALKEVRLPVRSSCASQIVHAKYGIFSIGLDPTLYGAHSLRRSKTTLICKRTGNFRAVQLPLGHTKIENPVRYIGIEVDDALEIAEQVDV